MKKRRSDAAIRQSLVTDRRQDSGLVTKRFHFSNDTIDKLHSIGKEMGYSDVELRKNENLSAILELCIDSFSDKSFEGKAMKKDALYLKQLYNIIKFREHKGYHDGAIADFLADWSYETPRLKKKLTEKWFHAPHWTPELVEKLKNEEYVQSQIDALNNRPKGKKPVKRKAKASTSSQRERSSDEYFRIEWTS